MSVENKQNTPAPAATSPVRICAQSDFYSLHFCSELPCFSLHCWFLTSLWLPPVKPHLALLRSLAGTARPLLAISAIEQVQFLHLSTSIPCSNPLRHWHPPLDLLQFVNIFLVCGRRTRCSIIAICKVLLKIMVLRNHLAW